MRALSAGELLDVWERGLAQSPAQRALILLAVASPDLPIEELALLTVGERDARLLSLREGIFGPHLESLTNCPACAERLEFRITVPDLRASASPSSDPLQISAAGHAIEFRLPTALDVASLDPAADAAMNRRLLLQRCVLTARHADAEIPPAELPDEAVAALTAKDGRG